MRWFRNKFLDLRGFRSASYINQDKDLFTMQTDVYRSGGEVYLSHHLLKQGQKGIWYLFIFQILFNINFISSKGCQD